MRRKMGSCFVVALAFLLTVAWAGLALGDTGIPVTSDLVLKMCTDCHKNNGGLVSRISYLRQVPEAWEETLWRHKRIHGLSITKDEKEALLLYFSDKQGLGPRRGGAVRLHPREAGHEGEGRQPVDRRHLRPVPQLREDRSPAPLRGRLAEARQHALGRPSDVALPAPGRHRLGRHAGRLPEGAVEAVPAGDSGVEAVERVAPDGGRGEVGRRRVPGRERVRTVARSR